MAIVGKAATAPTGTTAEQNYLQGLSAQSQVLGMTPQALGTLEQNPLVAALIGQEEPSIAQYNQQLAAAQGQELQLPAQLGLQGAQLQQTTQLQGEQLQNQAVGNQLQQQNVAQQLGIAGGQYGLQQQLAGIQQGQLNYNLPIAVQQLQGQAAIGGTLNTQGYGQKLGQLGEQYQVATGELANQLAGQGLSYQGTQLSSANQIAQLQNTAAGLGISAEQLQAQLASGMTQIGVQGQQTQDQLMAAAASAQAGRTQGQGAILSNIGAITGLGPQAFQK